MRHQPRTCDAPESPARARQGPQPLAAARSSYSVSRLHGDRAAAQWYGGPNTGLDRTKPNRGAPGAPRLIGFAAQPDVRPPTMQLRGRLHHRQGSTGFGHARSAFGRAGRACRRHLPMPLAGPIATCSPPILDCRRCLPSRRLQRRRRARRRRCCPPRDLIVLQAARVCRSVDAADRIPSGGRCADGASCRTAGGEGRFNWGCLAAAPQGWSSARAADWSPSGERCADEVSCARDHAGEHSQVGVARMWARGLGCMRGRLDPLRGAVR